MIRVIAKLFAATVVLTALLHTARLSAAPVVWISSTGSDSNPCTAAQPCKTFQSALGASGTGSQISCLNSPGPVTGGFESDSSWTIDCAGVYEPTTHNSGAIILTGGIQAVTIRNLTISGAAGGYPAISVIGFGTLIIENCVFENFSGGPALDIEPTGKLNLVVTNSRISNNASGVLLMPDFGGSMTATFDRVTIANNMGGGLKTNTTNGPVTVDISNSTIGNNGGNGLNAVGGAGGPNVLNLSHDVIASNGNFGLQANGVSAAAFVDTTLFDTNVFGATASVASGRLLTYSNNRVVGPIGSGFPSSVPLQ
jgi:hypothetical protein